MWIKIRLLHLPNWAAPLGYQGSLVIFGFCQLLAIDFIPDFTKVAAPNQ